MRTPTRPTTDSTIDQHFNTPLLPPCASGGKWIARVMLAKLVVLLALVTSPEPPVETVSCILSAVWEGGGDGA